MSDNDTPTPEWPRMPGQVVPPTAPSDNPLAPAHPKSLAPEPMPGEDPLTSADRTTDVTREPSPLPPGDPSVRVPCQSCGSDVAMWESFCEACGGELTPVAAAPQPAPDTPDSGPDLTQPTKATDPPHEPVPPAEAINCRECDGIVGPDRYCTMCGAKAIRSRDRFTENPSPWVAGVSDLGVRHHRNEDGMALAAYTQPGSRAIMVVCDGVTTSTDSDVASLAGARAARQVLMGALSPSQAVDHAALANSLQEAVSAANDAVVDTTAADSVNAASCTLTAALLVDGVLHHANIGDSRVYWIDDDPDRARCLTVDDSMAQARMDMGVPREQAEQSFQAHAITKWLGRDAADATARVGSLQVPGNGWILACSDGLWNYCSEAADLARLVAGALAEDPDAATPAGLATWLVRWACEQGGRDNVTVALARMGETPVAAPVAGAAPAVADSDVDDTASSDDEEGN